MENEQIVSIPGLDNYHASYSGDIYRDGIKIEQRKENIESAYRQVKIGEAAEYVHRLIALTFVPNPNNYNVVNHLDGDKLNNRADNLEWVLVKENVEHAYLTGLRPDNRPVKVYDHDTKETHHFHSLNKASEFIKVNPSLVSNYLGSPRECTFRGRWVIAWEFENWEELLKIPREFRPSGVMKPIILINEDGSEQMVFDGYASISWKMGIPKHRIHSLLNTKTGMTYMGWRFEYYNDSLDGVEVITKPQSETKRTMVKRVGTPISVLCLTTGFEKDWDSTEAFANSIGVKKNTVQKAVLVNPAGPNSGFYGKYKITYKR